MSHGELAEQRSMLRVLNRIWCQQEDERRKAKAEEASLYVTRSVLFVCLASFELLFIYSCSNVRFVGVVLLSVGCQSDSTYP